MTQRSTPCSPTPTGEIHRNIGLQMTFGVGVHYCLGAAVARLEGWVATEDILKRFPRGTSTGTPPSSRRRRPSAAGRACG